MNVPCLGSLYPMATCHHLSFPFAGIREGRYQYLMDLSLLEGCRDSRPVCCWPRGPSLVRLSNWRDTLISHPDQQFSAYIFNGLSEGFRIGFDRSVSLQTTTRNHPSAMVNPHVVQDRIQAEVVLGRVVGPIDRSLCPLVQSSPIGLVPKKGQIDQWRMIVDLSFPPGHSVNDGISKDLCSLSYASLDDAVDRILALGRRSELVKIDLKEAYRVIPIHPHDIRLLAVSWEGHTYVDRALPFGLRSAPKIFSAFADMVAWALFKGGIRALIHYLDDFLFFGSPDSSEGSSVLALALQVLENLGIPVAIHKTQGPATSVTFLGIVIDTQRFELRLPLDKVQHLRDLLHSWSTKRACTRKELESLLGHLSHAASIIRPGRTFLRQLFNLLSVARAPNHFVRLNLGARADIAWWQCFLESWNGLSFFPLPSPSVHVYSDASSGFGCGAFVQALGWFSLQWPDSWHGAGISAMELVPVVLAAVLWGKLWSGCHVCFYSDNTGVVGILSRRIARTPTQMHLLGVSPFLQHFSNLITPCNMCLAS